MTRRDVSDDVIESLLCWESASKLEKDICKRYFMPEEDCDNIDFIVSTHPMTDNHGRMTIQTITICVIENGYKIALIVINCNSRKAHYFIGSE
jgi:hypothetical protein